MVSATTERAESYITIWLWFAWKFVPLWYQQQRTLSRTRTKTSCDLLENSYLCGISNNYFKLPTVSKSVVICLKIRTFVVSATTERAESYITIWLWFAWKFVPLWYQQQLSLRPFFVPLCCDLLENSYLCGISNNKSVDGCYEYYVVICLKIRTFVVSATTANSPLFYSKALWFAWKFVPLWYQQQRRENEATRFLRCDLLENSYLCGISNNELLSTSTSKVVVICLKIRTFVVSATTVSCLTLA